MAIYILLSGHSFELSCENAQRFAHYVLKNRLYSHLGLNDVQLFGKEITQAQPVRTRLCADILQRDCLHWDKEDWLLFLMECSNPKNHSDT